MSSFAAERKRQNSGRPAEQDVTRHGEAPRSPPGVPLFLQRKLAVNQPGNALGKKQSKPLKW